MTARTTAALLVAALAVGACARDRVAAPDPTPSVDLDVADGLALVRAALDDAVKTTAGQFAQSWTMSDDGREPGLHGASRYVVIATFDREREARQYRVDTFGRDGKPARLLDAAGVPTPYELLMVYDELAVRPAGNTRASWMPVAAREVDWLVLPREAGDNPSDRALVELRSAILSATAPRVGPRTFRVELRAGSLTDLAPSAQDLETALVPLPRKRGFRDAKIPAEIELNADGELRTIKVDLSKHLLDQLAAAATTGYVPSYAGRAISWTYEARFEVLDPPLALPTSLPSP